MKKTIENFQFTDLAQLREWLNMFHTTPLEEVFPDGAGHVNLTWIEETLSDGSKVQNFRIETQEG